MKSDVLIIGAGLVGSSVAMHLAQKGVKGIRVLDFDLEGVLSSSELNAGGVRATFNQPVNIWTSKVSIEYFAQHAQDVGYRACGYLWMNTPERMERSARSREIWTHAGWPTEAWDVAELRRRVPFIDKTDDLAGAVFAPRDGLLNPNSLKLHYRRRAMELGVEFVNRVWVKSVEYSGTQVKVKGLKYPAEMDGEARARVLSFEDSSAEAERVEFQADVLVNCAGAWAGGLSKLMGYASPTVPVRRQICVFDCRDVDLTHYGMMIDPSGVYFHPEATNGMAGFANREEPEGINFQYDGEDFFMNSIWPALFERSSKFERLRHLNGWAGLYEVSPDESGIVGLVESGTAGKHGQVYEAHSFSGHGAMHSYGVGLVLAERITGGRYESFDYSVLSGARFGANRLIHESQVI